MSDEWEAAQADTDVCGFIQELVVTGLHEAEKVQSSIEESLTDALETAVMVNDQLKQLRLRFNPMAILAAWFGISQEISAGDEGSRLPDDASGSDSSGGE